MTASDFANTAARRRGAKTKSASLICCQNPSFLQPAVKQHSEGTVASSPPEDMCADAGVQKTNAATTATHRIDFFSVAACNMKRLNDSISSHWLSTVNGKETGRNGDTYEITSFQCHCINLLFYFLDRIFASQCVLAPETSSWSTAWRTRI